MPKLKRDTSSPQPSHISPATTRQSHENRVRARSGATRISSSDPASLSEIEHGHQIKAVACSGDQNAYRILFRHYFPRVRCFLLKLGSSPLIADELAQDTLLSVWKHAAHFDSSRARASTWVFTIARNIHIDEWRHKKRRGQLNALCTGSAINGALDDECSTHDLIETLHSAIDLLSEEQARLVRLSFLEERAHREIAAQLDVPLGTVKSRMRQAVIRLRSIIAKTE